MMYTRKELEQLMVEGIGAAMQDFMAKQSSGILVAVAVRENLGKLYHRLLLRHAEDVGYYYHQTYSQEALYVIEKKWTHPNPLSVTFKRSPRQSHRACVGLHAGERRSTLATGA